MPKYFGNWTSREDVARDFDVDVADFPPDDAILFASYGTPSYEGYGQVLYREGGKLMEVQGSHCSCYGLEGQWKPDEVIVEQLKLRPGLSEWHEHGTDAVEAWDVLVAALPPSPEEKP